MPRETMTVINAETAPYLDAFRSRRRSEPGWLAARREAALARFGELGFPSRREEAWRFTDLRPLQRTAFPPGTPGRLQGYDLLPGHQLDGAAHRLVFVDGVLVPGLSAVGSLPGGVWLGSAAAALAERPALLQAALDQSDVAGAQPFASLNAAFFSDGFVLALDPGARLEKPVEVIHLSHARTAQSWHLRNAVLLGPGSEASLIESFAGDGTYWTNSVSVLRLGEAAVLRHVKVQDEPRDAIHFAVDRVALGAAARLDSFGLTLGARLSRQDVLVSVAGEKAACTVNGACLLRGQQEATLATLVDHAAPGGTTRELFKAVVDDRAHAVFLGSIAVRPEAQKTDAQQTSRNLLLSPRAAVDTKPELEILADDVKCSHGATVGDLDQAALFYLMSRGIAAPDARRLLIEAFAADAIDMVPDAALRAHLGRHLRRWLADRGE